MADDSTRYAVMYALKSALETSSLIRLVSLNFESPWDWNPSKMPGVVLLEGDTQLNRLSFEQDSADDMECMLNLRVRGYVHDPNNVVAVKRSALIADIEQILMTSDWKWVRNYLGNSGFENPTISNSWIASGTDTTFTRTASGLYGTYRGSLTSRVVQPAVYQDVLFTGTKALEVGDTYTFSIWVNSGDVAFSLQLLERSGSTTKQTVTGTATTSVSGWKKESLSITITDATSDRLRCLLYGSSLAAGPLLYWPLDDISGGVTPDLSGNGYDGTITGGSVLSPGIVGDGWTASGGKIDSPALTLGSSITISGWIYGPITNATMLWSHNTDSTTPPYIDLFFQAGQVYNNLGDSYAFPFGTYLYPTDGLRHHFVVVHAPGGSNLYVDGALVGTATYHDPTATAESFRVSGWAQNTNYRWSGSVDEIRIYNRALSLAEVQYLYNNPACGTILADGAMLTQTAAAVNWYVENSADGTSGEVSADLSNSLIKYVNPGKVSVDEGNVDNFGILDARYDLAYHYNHNRP